MSETPPSQPRLIAGFLDGNFRALHAASSLEAARLFEKGLTAGMKLGRDREGFESRVAVYILPDDEGLLQAEQTEAARDEAKKAFPVPVDMQDAPAADVPRSPLQRALDQLGVPR